MFDEHTTQALSDDIITLFNRYGLDGGEVTVIEGFKNVAIISVVRKGSNPAGGTPTGHNSNLST